MPGYCVQGTVGAQVLGGAKKIEIDRQTVEVKLSVEVSVFYFVNFGVLIKKKKVLSDYRYKKEKERRNTLFWGHTHYIFYTTISPTIQK